MTDFVRKCTRNWEESVVGLDMNEASAINFVVSVMQDFSQRHERHPKIRNISYTNGHIVRNPPKNPDREAQKHTLNGGTSPYDYIGEFPPGASNSFRKEAKFPLLEGSYLGL